MGSDLNPDWMEDLLPRVEKASRYLGTEMNAVHKDAASLELRVALAFPDVYDMGLGNLGLLILYAILNDRAWCWCERAYAPAPDMEAMLRERGLPLTALESGEPLKSMDLIGFTLQSELTYTNILNMLDLAGIALHVSERADPEPLVCAGGPCAFNPEPLADFIDFFVIGDGEDAVVEIAEALRATRGRPRLERLEAVARVEGVYAPALHRLEEDGGGESGRSRRVVKRVTANLDGARFPADYIVPFTQQVHDRISLEVMRGCTHGCRFCLAGMANRPVRERTLESIGHLMDEALQRTGYEELSLVSLSTCDYSDADALLRQAEATASARMAAVSLPSLRLDSFSVSLADRVAGLRRSGLTFAPEAGTARLRAVINKNVREEDLLTAAADAFRLGWGHVKLYFMIGLPTETDEDVQAIVELCRRTLQACRAVTPKARIHTGISTFVPKPFTPFQWAAQISPEETRRRQDILRRGFAGIPGVKFGHHAVEATFVEGLISRADRTVGGLIEAAWRHGARFESSDEHIRLEAWERALEETGYRVEDGFRARGMDEPLPWDFVDAKVSRDWLWSEYERALVGEVTPDCREGRCHQCGISDSEHGLCGDIRERVAEARAQVNRDGVTDTTAAGEALHEEPPAVQRVRFRIGRTGRACYLSHLETASAWHRALRRTGAPLSYTQGFHAHPKVSFSTASPVGEASEGDYMDVILRERVEPSELLERLSGTLPPGFLAIHAADVRLDGPSLMSAVTGFRYMIQARNAEPETLKNQALALREADTLEVTRPAKPGKRHAGRGKGRPSTHDLRPMLVSLDAKVSGQGCVEIELETRVIDGRSLRPRDLGVLLGLQADDMRVTKRDTFLA